MAKVAGRPLPRSRTDADCGLAALSHYLHVPYEDVYVAAAKAVPKFSRTSGLTLKGMQAVALRLGTTLSVVNYRRVVLDEHTGILGLNWVVRRGGREVIARHGHWVVLREGTIIDPSGAATWDADDYLLTNKARIGHLLTDMESRR
jgi:hypothetical protein